jgi:hypothetical protein
MSAKFNFEDFLARSTDKEFSATTLARILAGLPDLGAHGPWIAGGAVRRTALAQEPDSDFDFFFRNADQLAVFAADLEGKGFTKFRETEHHLHYRGYLPGDPLQRDIQCIRFSFYESAEQVINSFDFTLCMLAFDGLTLTVGDFTLWDLGRKRLAVNRITFPVSSMRRLLKYTRQGFYACNGALNALLKATAENPKLRTDIAYVD